MASKKITEMTVATGLEDTDILTGVDNSAGVADKNVQITKANLGFAADDDPRLSDSRDPNTHASTHGDGSTDPVSIKSSQVTDFQTTVSENPTVVENTKKVGGPAGGVSDAELSLFDGTSGKLIRGGSAIEAASYTFGTIPGGVLTNLRGNEAVGLFARGSDGTLQDAIGLMTYVYVDGVAPTDGLVLLRGINVHLDGLTSTKLLVNGVDKLTVDGSLITAADPVVLPADPTTDLQATTKQYVDGTSVPAGGTTDQVLAKASDLDHALKWAAPGTGGTAPDLSQWDMAGRLSVDPGPYESVNPTTLGVGQWNASISLLGWNAAGQLKKFGPSVYEQYDVAMRLSSGDGRVEPSGVADLLPAASVAALTYALVWKPDGSLGVVDLNTIGGGSGADTKVGVSATDTTPDYLQEKLTSGDASVSITRINAGADEQLDIRATGAGGGGDLDPAPIWGIVPDWVSQQQVAWSAGSATVNGATVTYAGGDTGNLAQGDPGMSTTGVWCHWLYDAGGGVGAIELAQESAGVPTWDDALGYWIKGADATRRLIGWHPCMDRTDQRIIHRFSVSTHKGRALRLTWGIPPGVNAAQTPLIQLVSTSGLTDSTRWALASQVVMSAWIPSAANGAYLAPKLFGQGSGGGGIVSLSPEDTSADYGTYTGDGAVGLYSVRQESIANGGATFFGRTDWFPIDAPHTVYWAFLAKGDTTVVNIEIFGGGMTR